MGRPRWNGRAPPGSDVPGGSRLGIREFDRRFRCGSSAGDPRPSTAGRRGSGRSRLTDRVVLIGVVAAGLWLAGRRARTWRGDIAGVPALASVAILLCVSPVFSLEYAAWLIPWAAIAATEDPGATYALAVAAVEAATGLLAILYVGFAAESLSKDPPHPAERPLPRDQPCLAHRDAEACVPTYSIPFGRVGVGAIAPRTVFYPSSLDRVEEPGRFMWIDDVRHPRRVHARPLNDDEEAGTENESEQEQHRVQGPQPVPVRQTVGVEHLGAQDENGVVQRIRSSSAVPPMIRDPPHRKDPREDTAPVEGGCDRQAAQDRERHTPRWRVNPQRDEEEREARDSDNVEIRALPGSFLEMGDVGPRRGATQPGRTGERPGER